MAKPTQATSKSFESDVLNSDLPVVVDFWAPWCAPCRMIGPVLEDLAVRYDGRVKVVKVNVDDEKALAEAYGIRGIPTVLGFSGGEVQQQQVGFRGAQGLERMFEDLTGEVRVSL
ncbi:MAG: thioredoxin [Proteobacteria bacterium]|nr:MAG: thioredoxin [Pseudomonadota bacterium]